MFAVAIVGVVFATDVAVSIVAAVAVAVAVAAAVQCLYGFVSVAVLFSGIDATSSL